MLERPLILTAVVLALLLARSGHLSAADPLLRVTFTDENQSSRAVDGKLLVEAADGGILLLGRDGRLWNITPDQLESREETGESFRPLASGELAALLKEERGAGFETIATKHYVICTNAGPRYAEWCGALFERLHAGFRTHWRSPELALHDPEFPLPAIIFARREQFVAYAQQEIGAGSANSHGYYSIRTNRMVLYDITAGADDRPAVSFAEIERKIQNSPYNVATIVHEATHQIAFNSGMHTRYADNPVWLSEGMAMYFETPDLRSRNGWRTIGQINPTRLRQFQEYARTRRPPDSLETLISTNERFADPELGADAYAEAWALTYFLIKTRRENYVAYLARLSRKPALIWDTPDERLAEFTAVFGNLSDLDQQFLRYLQRTSR